MNARNKPLSVSITLQDPTLDATLRALSFAEHSTMRKEARRLLEGALRYLYESDENLRALADTLLAEWVKAGLIDSPNPVASHLRLMK